MKKALFPGSFDPFHKGHLKILEKSLKLFDFIYVVISNNEAKKNQNDINIRYLNAKKLLEKFLNIEVIKNENELTAILAKRYNIDFIIRSARNNIDFDYEIYLANQYKKINPNLEVVLFFPDNEDLLLSSSLIKKNNI